MTTPTASLRALAQAADPGVSTYWRRILPKGDDPNGDFCSEVTPEVILALLSRLDRQERALRDICDEVAGSFACQDIARAALADEGDA